MTGGSPRSVYLIYGRLATTTNIFRLLIILSLQALEGIFTVDLMYRF